jgi:hypothetical protein
MNGFTPIRLQFGANSNSYCLRGPIRDALLSRLLSGQFRVKEAARGAAEVT